MKEVSVIIPVYNCESTIERALQSVADQTYKDFEVILVDNNCTDRTIDIAKKFSNCFELKIVECKDPGIVPALNTGLRRCTGDWIARQDGDDFWYSEKLQKQMSFLKENPNVDIIGTQIRLLDEASNIQELGTFGKAVKYQLEDVDIKKGFLYGQNQICHPSVVFSRSLINVLGGYERLFPLAEDLHLWLRAFPHFTFANLPEVLIDYTQKKSDNYDARVPVLLADWYYNMFKASGIVTGDREKLIWDWQTREKGYKHSD